MALVGAGKYAPPHRCNASARLGLGLLIVCPHTQDTNRFLFGKNLIDHAVLNIDASRVGASKITNQLFEGRGILKRVVGKNRQQF